MARSPNKAARSFGRAKERVLDLNKTMVNATVVIPQSLDDVVRWLWPPHIWRALHAAFPFTETYNRAAYTGSLGGINFVLQGQEVKVMFHVDTHAAGYLTPVKTSHRPDREHPIVEHIAKVVEIHGKFEDVKNVLDYFQGQKSGLAIMKTVWPIGLTLMPEEYTANIVASNNTPLGFTGHIQNLMRETQGTIATAMMLEKAAIKRELKDNFNIMINNFFGTSFPLI